MGLVFVPATCSWHPRWQARLAASCRAHLGDSKVAQPWTAHKRDTAPHSSLTACLLCAPKYFCSSTEPVVPASCGRMQPARPLPRSTICLAQAALSWDFAKDLAFLGKHSFTCPPNPSLLLLRQPSQLSYVNQVGDTR